MGMEYNDLRAMVFETTGFSLPESEPEIGKQFSIPLPNAEFQTDQDAHAVCAYFGKGDVYIKAEATGEAYRFKDGEYFVNGCRERIEDLVIIAREKRGEVLHAHSLKQYKQALKADLNNHPVLKKMGFDFLPHSGMKGYHSSFVPEGIELGELKTLEGSILQVFWGFKHRYEEKEYFKNERLIVTTVRTHSLTGSLDGKNPLDVSPSIHIHQLHPDMPVIWTVGFQNALNLKVKFPDFSVIEAYSLSHLWGVLKLTLPMRNNVEFVGLSKDDLDAFNKRCENCSMTRMGTGQWKAGTREISSALTTFVIGGDDEQQQT